MIWPPRIGRSGSLSGLVLAAFVAAGVSASVLADDEPPATESPLEQIVENLRAQFQAGVTPMDSLALANASTDPLDSKSVKVDDAGLIEMHVRDTEIAAVLEMLSYQAQSNIVATRSVTGTVSANLYGLTLAEALDAILTPNQYAYRQSGATIFVGTPTEIAAQGPPPETRVLHLRFIGTTEASNALKSVLSADGVIMASDAEDTSAGASASKNEEVAPAGADYLIVTDTPAYLDAAERLLELIDVRPKQVLVEATILRATLNENNQFGIDFTLLGGVDFQNVNSISNASSDIATGLTPPDKLQRTTFNVNTDLIGNLAGGGLTFGIIKDSVGAFVQALEEVTDVAVVANPKIIALNRQEAEVIVGRRDGYLTTTVTETAAVQTVEFLETGTQIKFRPFINGDNTVRLTVHPKDSNGGLTSSDLPFEETTEAQADILVDDGRTVLIGGLFRERNVSSKGQVPVIGNIPFAGLLFQHASDEMVREEVVILLTVHVLKDTDAEYNRFADLLEDVERIRIGSRKGLLGTGRERLAQAFYKEAIRQVEEDRPGRALLNIRMALHNEPKHLAALKLKERLLGRRMWDNEGSRTRLFLVDLIRQEEMSLEREDSSRLFGRPPLDLEIHRGDPTATEAASPAEETP